MRLAAVVTLSVLAAALASPARAVVIGEIDTFAGSIENWFAGGGPSGQVPPVPPAVQASGGPGGAGDSFMTVTSLGGNGAGSRLVAINTAQWAGNYTAAGIAGIAMDLRNFGTSDLTLRLLFEDPIPGPAANQAVTSLGVTVAAGGGWTHVVFPILPADLTVLLGNPSTLLANTTVLRLFHGTTAAFPGAAVSGVLGVDNIAAVAGGTADPVGVPAPDSLALMLAGLGLLGACSGRRRGVTAARRATAPRRE